MKDSFILYNSFYEPIKSLSDEQLGRLFRAIFNYTIKGEITQEESIKIAFMFIKNQLDMDITKWKETKKKRSEAGKKHKGNQYFKMEQMEQMEQVFKNGSDNENDNVNVNVNVNNIKENNKRKVFKPPTLEEVKNYCKERNNGIDAELFIDFYEAKEWMIGKNKIKDWKACIRTWEKNRKPKEEKEIPSWFGKEIKKEEVDDETRRLIEEIEGTSVNSS